MDEFHADFARIVKKADQIVTREVLTKQRMDELNALREEDGRISAKLNQLVTQLEQQQILHASSSNDLDMLEEEYDSYFQLLNQYSHDPEQLHKQLEKHIENYNWAVYSKIQDKKFDLQKQRQQSYEQIKEIKKELIELDSIRTQLRDTAIELMSEIDNKLRDLQD